MTLRASDTWRGREIGPIMSMSGQGRPRKAGMGDIMDARDWDRRYEDRELLWGAGPNRFVAQEVSQLSPGRALDLATGEGRNAIWLAERGWRVDAIDYSPVGLDRARRLAAERGVDVTFIEADLTTCQLARRAYDLVLVVYLHLPWAEMQPILQRAANAVAPGGTFLCVGHDLTNLDAGYGGPQSPEVLTTPETVAAALSDLDIQRAEVVKRPVQVEAGEVVEALDHLVRAIRR